MLLKRTGMFNTHLLSTCLKKLFIILLPGVCIIFFSIHRKHTNYGGQNGLRSHYGLSMCFFERH